MTEQEKKKALEQALIPVTEKFLTDHGKDAIKGLSWFARNQKGFRYGHQRRCD